MSQMKMKSLEGRKEVRHTPLFSFLWGTWALTLAAVMACRLCDSCCPLACSSLLYAELWAAGMLEAGP